MMVVVVVMVGRQIRVLFHGLLRTAKPIQFQFQLQF